MKTNLTILRNESTVVPMYYGNVPVHITEVEGDYSGPYRHFNVTLPNKGFQIIKITHDLAFDPVAYNEVANMTPRQWIEEIDHFGDELYVQMPRLTIFYIPLN